MSLLTRNLLIIFAGLLLTVFPATSASAKPRIKVIKLSIANRTEEPRPREDVVVQVADLKKIDPDFRPSDVIVLA